MCGIAGFNWPDSLTIKKMTDRIIHRGPDAEGFYIDDKISLGHRRLSIIDLSELGNQPMTYESFVIAFNGEIYNYLDIKKELILKGHQFKSNSDTEVILHAYKEWGTNCVKRFNGMWAFCIYDKIKEYFFLSRDRFGVKPLYYYFKDNHFIFASEIKAIRQHELKLEIEPKAINYYFYQKYIGRNFTIFKDIYKLEPSKNLIFNVKDKTHKFEQYYKLEEEIEKVKENSVIDRIKKIEEIIEDSIHKRLISDVPVGSFLSGGIDSSLISAIIALKKNDFNTFSIGFKEKSYNELDYSILVSKHIKTVHNYQYLDFEDSMIEYVIQNMDEPFGDSSIFPTYLLSKITKEKVTVSISGDAGDEVFGGYDTYLAYKIASVIPSPLFKAIKMISRILPVSDKKVSLSFKIKRFIRNDGQDINLRHLNWMATFTDDSRIKLLETNFIPVKELVDYPEGKDLLSIQLNDIYNYLPEDILKKVDLASMLSSLEARTPFLDFRLVPIVLSLPENLKIKRFTTKWLLKMISVKYLPSKIIHRKKRGFTVPVSNWIKNNKMIQEYLSEKKYYDHNFINYSFSKSLLEQHLSGKNNYARELWLIFVFNYWISKAID